MTPDMPPSDGQPVSKAFQTAIDALRTCGIFGDRPEHDILNWARSVVPDGTLQCEHISLASLELLVASKRLMVVDWQAPAVELIKHAAPMVAPYGLELSAVSEEEYTETERLIVIEGNGNKMQGIVLESEHLIGAINQLLNQMGATVLFRRLDDGQGEDCEFLLATDDEVQCMLEKQIIS